MEVAIEAMGFAIKEVDAAANMAGVVPPLPTVGHEEMAIGAMGFVLREEITAANMFGVAPLLPISMMAVAVVVLYLVLQHVIMASLGAPVPIWNRKHCSHQQQACFN